MQIQGDFYKITSIDDSSPFWDLELLKTIKSKTNPRQEYVNAGYGLTLDSAIKRIIQFAISSKYDVLTLKDYLQAYNKLSKSITNAVS